MTLGDRLREADQRFVPAAAARLRAVLDAPAHAGPDVLRRLDDRYATRGPLGLLARAPQLGILVAVVLLLTGGGTVLARSGDGRAPERARAAALQGPPVLGPDVGAQVAAYVAGARAGAAQASQSDPEVLHLALVSLSDYRTPAAADQLLAGLDVQRVYLRVPAGEDPTEVLPVDVHDLAGDLRRLYAATAERKAREQQDDLGLARSLPPGSEEEKRFRGFYEASARTAGREASAYRSGCACVFAVVVRAPARVLAELPALAGVRAVELAPAGATFEQLRVRPLLPEQDTVVVPLPRPSLTGG